MDRHNVKGGNSRAERPFGGRGPQFVPQGERFAARVASRSAAFSSVYRTATDHSSRACCPNRSRAIHGAAVCPRPVTFTATPSCRSAAASRVLIRSPHPDRVEPPSPLAGFTFPDNVRTLAVVPGPRYVGATRRHVMYVVTSKPSTDVVGVLKTASSPSKRTWRSTSVPIKCGSAAPCGVRMNVRRSSSTT